MLHANSSQETANSPLANEAAKGRAQTCDTIEQKTTYTDKND
jgi:hypothetical protein